MATFKRYIVETLVKDFGGSVKLEDRMPGDHTKSTRSMNMLPAVAKLLFF